MGMYDHLMKVSENVTIMGYPFYAEDIESDEPYNRRERNFTQILGGTERISKGEYVHRQFSFSSIISYPPGNPKVYDSIFKKMVSDPVEVISPSMGGKFKALINIKKSYPYPNRIKLDVTVTEVPDKKSNISNEKFTVPPVKKIKVTASKTSSKKSSKKSNKKNKSKSKKNTVKKKNK